MKSSRKVKQVETDITGIKASVQVTTLLAQKSLLSQEVKHALGDGDPDNINSDLIGAITLLNNSGVLTKQTLNALILPGVAASASASMVASEIVLGLENLKKLEQYGMNTEKNQNIVIALGREGMKASIELWEKAKSEIQASVKASKSNEHSSFFNNPAARAGARAAKAEQLEELDKVSQELHRPEKQEKPKLSKGG